jgi:hypothetical protein
VFPEGGDSESYHKNKAKRVRTTFTEEQLQVLQANFQLDSNPDGQDLERIAQITGLSKRVTQVWFQNSRARQKKHLHTGKMKTPSELRFGIARFEVLTAVVMKGTIFWDITPCSPLSVNRRFGETYRFHLQGIRRARTSVKAGGKQSSLVS